MRSATSVLQRGLLLSCQTLTSPRRQRRDVHPECFPPAPKCCTFITRRGGRVFVDTKGGGPMSKRTNAGFDTSIKTIFLRALQLQAT